MFVSTMSGLMGDGATERTMAGIMATRVLRGLLIVLALFHLALNLPALFVLSHV